MDQESRYSFPGASGLRSYGTAINLLARAAAINALTGLGESTFKRTREVGTQSLVTCTSPQGCLMSCNWFDPWNQCKREGEKWKLDIL